MPRLKHKPPGYCRHKASGQAVVAIDGRDVYLGPYGSPDSKRKYAEVVAQWLASGSQPTVQIGGGVPPNDLRISELLVAYLEHAERYYRKNDRPTGEFRNIQDAIRPLRKLYESSRVAQFGPVALRNVRQVMISDGLARKVVNARVNRIRRIIKWGVENQLVDPVVLQGIQSVAPLKKGRSDAKETEPVQPVPGLYIDAVKPYLTRQVAAMIDVQRLTGMRPGEVVVMRGCDLDMSGRLWVYVPASHKTEHHGIQRTIYIGPRAQEIIRPFLKRDLTAYLFSPSDAMEEIRTRRAMDRKTKQYGRRPRRKLRPRKRPGAHYTSSSYCYAIHKACRKARIPCWGPNRLRHNAATFLRKQYGIEAARVILGHRSAAITEVYAEMDLTKAAAIMAEIG